MRTRAAATRARSPRSPTSSSWTRTRATTILSNSYTSLYGDLDVDRALAFLDERYLSQPSAASRRMDAAVAAGEDPSTLAPNPLGVQAPVTCEYKRIEMATTPENALVGLGLVLGSALDRKRTIAADILFEALLGSNEAPVKKAILAAGLGGNVVSYTAAESLQPYELIMLQNAQPGVARELRRVFQDACRDLCEHGVPRERLEAIISSNEYDLRQRDYGIADGVAIACDALSTWLYDDDAATLALKYGPVYEELRGELDGSYLRTCCASWCCKTITWHWSSWCRWTPPRVRRMPRPPSWRPSAMP